MEAIFIPVESILTKTKSKRDIYRLLSVDRKSAFSDFFYLAIFFYTLKSVQFHF